MYIWKELQVVFMKVIFYFKQSINSSIMKKLFLILFICFFFNHLSQSQDFSIVGTWKLVGQKSVRNGLVTTFVLNSDNGIQLKSWTKENFLFAGKTINNNQVSYSCGHGNYTLQGNQYVEIIKVHANPTFEGRTLKLYMELNGDTLTQISPVRSDLSYDKQNCWMEKYVKVE